MVMALLMGFTGSFHCAGMCGPIIWIMPFQMFQGAKKIAALFFYHFARISVYALIALVLHYFRNLFNPQVQQYISLFLGGFLLLIGIMYFLSGFFSSGNLPWASFVKTHLGKVVGKPGLGSITIAGMLNGMLPCGLVYMALSASLTLNSTIDVLGLIYFFGAGTLPMLIGITLMKNKLRFLRVNNYKKFAPVLVFSFGCLFVLRGMNLGIPYLSPKVEVVHNEIHSCCHKR